MAEHISLISEFCRDYYSSQKCAEIPKLFLLKYFMTYFALVQRVAEKSVGLASCRAIKTNRDKIGVMDYFTCPSNICSVAQHWAALCVMLILILRYFLKPTAVRLHLIAVLGVWFKVASNRAERQEETQFRVMRLLAESSEIATR